ncbi:hypothetical protein JN11_04289 [Mucilaginibacter frigoritolerans]|jgi:hypothetical protein|uniref:MotA/TolQ/ExbB proton channel domain-containing protein n=1 Tax=Mucilaginibacter frigoritolerans TaxID=652788 RepID=A0A562TRY9_9SPHI|nr:hypothetical protein [Mucilaginibacter frigoritolerans]TWI95550.1 hypothetical protein JN11_04289 [Mucilaginibacter frigoritolerans]
MKTKIILTIIFILPVFMLKAQQTIKSHAQPDSIIKFIPIQTLDTVVYAYTIGGKLATRQEIAFRLMTYAPSAEEYHQFKNNMTWGSISGGAFGISSLASVIAFHNSSKNAVTTMGTVHNNSGAYIFTGIATAFLGSAIINWIYGAKHFKKSIKVYNQRFE